MSTDPNNPNVPAPDEHLPPESITPPETSSLSESPDNLPPDATQLPEPVPPKEESSLTTIGTVVFFVGIFFLMLFANSGSNSNPGNSYGNPYESPYSVPDWSSKQKLPPDTLSQLRIQELQEAETETANWLDDQRAKTPGEIYRMNIGAIVFVATQDSSTSTDSASSIHLMGSGVVISSSKYGFCILTAEHLLISEYYKKDSTLLVYFKGMANPQPVKLAERSKNYDAMILQFADPKFQPRQTAVLGKSSLLNAGTELYGIGNCSAGVFLLAKGIVSAKPHALRIPKPSAYPDPRRKKTDYKWPTAILADITIASGFSGGPLFNKLGQLIGLNIGVITDIAGNISVGLPIDDLQKDFNNIF